MIIDKILDRKDGQKYNDKKFYNEVTEYGNAFIANALDTGTEQDVKKALCDYIISQDYNPDICNYINSVKWILTEN